MCYLIAKKFKEEGCIAFQTTSGKQMADFIEKIQNEISDNVHDNDNLKITNYDHLKFTKNGKF